MGEASPACRKKTRQALDALEAEAIIGGGTNNECGLVTYTAAELQHKEIPPLRWIVPGMIPEGLMVLAGKSGLGKSYFALQLGAAVASGGPALGGIPVEQGEVLYCALEDGPRRMQFRLQQSTQDGAAWPSEMHFTHDAPRIDEGLVNRLRLWL
jgi:RecA-family ATPase